MQKVVCLPAVSEAPTKGITCFTKARTIEGLHELFTMATDHKNKRNHQNNCNGKQARESQDS